MPTSDKTTTGVAKPTYLITGATGNVGRAAAAQLLEHGLGVRAFVRDASKAADLAKLGAEIRVGELTSEAALVDALRGVAGAFFLVPPPGSPDANFTEGKAVIAAVTRALAVAPPPRVVVLSSVGAELPDKTGPIVVLHHFEEALRETKIPVAHVRAGYFLENLAWTVQAAGATGEYPSFLQPTSRPIPMVATRDIADQVVRLCTAPAWAGTRVVELGALTSPDDVAAALAVVVGRDVKAIPVPQQAWYGALTSQGLHPARAEQYVEMTAGLNAGRIGFQGAAPGASIENIIAPTTPLVFFSRLAKAARVQ